MEIGGARRGRGGRTGHRKSESREQQEEKGIQCDWSIILGLLELSTAIGQNLGPLCCLPAVVVGEERGGKRRSRGADSEIVK